MIGKLSPLLVNEDVGIDHPSIGWINPYDQPTAVHREVGAVITEAICRVPLRERTAIGRAELVLEFDQFHSMTSLDGADHGISRPHMRRQSNHEVEDDRASDDEEHCTGDHVPGPSSDLRRHSIYRIAQKGDGPGASPGAVMWSRAACKPSSVPIPARTALRVGRRPFLWPRRCRRDRSLIRQCRAPAVHPPPTARAGRR